MYASLNIAAAGPAADQAAFVAALDQAHARSFHSYFTQYVLTDDEAFDVAAYVLSQPRPVKAGLDKDFPARWNKPVDAAFPSRLSDAETVCEQKERRKP